MVNWERGMLQINKFNESSFDALINLTWLLLVSLSFSDETIGLVQATGNKQ